MSLFGLDQQSSPRASPRQHLTLLDSTSIIVGIIIGSTYLSQHSPDCRAGSQYGWLVGVWVIGAVFSLIGALCYAELATAYPKEGGDYVFLTEAFGRKVGFLFAWTQFWIVRPGSVGTLAFVFADYANQTLPAAGKSLSPLDDLCRGRRGGAERHQLAGRASGQVDAELADPDQVPWAGGDHCGGHECFRCR